jgi:hypothetical protein
MLITNERDIAFVYNKFPNGWAEVALTGRAADAKPMKIRALAGMTFELRDLDGNRPHGEHTPIMLGQLYREIMFNTQFLPERSQLVAVERITDGTRRALTENCISYIQPVWRMLNQQKRRSEQLSGLNKGINLQAAEVVKQIYTGKFLSFEHAIKKARGIGEAAISQTLGITESLDPGSAELWLWTVGGPIGTIHEGRKEIVLKHQDFHQEVVDYLNRNNLRDWRAMR